jgi:hypothetical protein
MTPGNAEILALEGLGWLVQDADGLQRFLNHSGLEADGLRRAAGTADMSVAVLDFLLGHEDILLRFCESAGVSSRDLHLARHRLGGEA